MTNATPQKRLESLIALTEELSSVIERENALLKSRRPSALTPLQGEKARLATAYANAIRQIAADRSILTDASAQLVSDLREITQSFERRAQEQRGLIAGAQQTTENVLSAIAQEAKTDEAPSYATPQTPRSEPLFINEQS